MEGLFERGRELGQLQARLSAAAAGDGSLVLVEGPAGIGKSRLLAEFRRDARQTMRVLSARGSELEQEFAFGVVRQLFEADLAVPERRERLLAGAASSAAVVFGDLDPEVGQGASFAALHGLYWLVLNLAEEGPVLLSVDDLHWCDRPSLRFLEYLARRLEGQPVLLVAGLRDAEPGVDPLLLGALTHDPATTVVRPGPLTAESIERIIIDQLGSPPDQPFLDVCLDSTGGSPLLLTQLLTALRADGVRPDAAHVEHVLDVGPRAVSRTVLLRLARLGADAQAVARAVAILSEGAALPAVAELAGVSETATAEALGELAVAAILRPGSPPAFVHPLVRDAIYHELSPAQRARQHARAAAILRDAGAVSERVAAQLLQASPRGEPWVIRLLREAGAAAMRAGAPDSAASYLRRCLDEEVPEADLGNLLLELGTAELLISGRDAATHLTQAYEILTEPAARAQAAGLICRILLFTRSAEEASAFARRAAAEVPPELVDLRRQLDAFEYMTGYFGAGDMARLKELRAYRDLAPDAPGSCMLLAMAAWEAVCGDGTAELVTELALRSLEGDFLRTADPTLIWFAASNAVIVADRPEASAIFQSALAEAHRRGALFTVAAIGEWFGFALYRQGDLAAAEEMLRGAIEGFTVWGYNTQAVTTVRCFLAQLLFERGQTEEAIDLLESLGSTDPGEHTTGWWLATRVPLLVGTGRAAEALPLVEAMAARAASGADSSRLWCRSMKASVLWALGRGDEALALAKEELELNRAFGGGVHLGRSLRVVGLIEGGEAGLAHLREAVETLENSPSRLEFAEALYGYGRALRKARRPSDAREPLLRALELASACGVEPLAASVRTELQAAGVRPRRDAITGVGSLTPSERRVVDLAMAGRANRDIAQELYVTPKTVEVHLSSAYRKLGIRSRGELEDALSA